MAQRELTARPPHPDRLPSAGAPNGSPHSPTEGEGVRAPTLSAAGLDLEVVRRGAGRPMLLLHGFQNVDPRTPFLDLLGRHAEIIAPSHPGFGGSPRPADFETVYDLVHLYLEVLETLAHETVTVVGLSFGGWLAAEVAAASCH